MAFDRRPSEGSNSDTLLPVTSNVPAPSPAQELASSSSVPEARPVLYRLYTSHLLSAWNSRMFEFGAVLFLASIFPGTLLYASIYALVRALSPILLSSWMGSRVDKSDRLVALRHSIGTLHILLWCGSEYPLRRHVCALWPFSATENESATSVLFVAVVLLACIEKLAATANTVAVERDWAIVISDSIKMPRQDLNASMRRIDLICKLIAPVFISLVDSFSTKFAIWTVLGLNVASVLIEYIAIAQVYQAVPALKKATPAGRNEETDETLQARRDSSEGVLDYLRGSLTPWKEYVSSRVFLPSFALSLLYMTVLSFGATMVTYLLHSGFDSLQVSCMRIGSVAAEVSGTWIAPLIMNRIGPIRSGLWFLNWQFCCVAGAALTFALWDSNSQMVAGSLIVGVALSRIGLWGFDLSAQFLVQENVEEHARARFSSTEMALQNIFEMLSFASTIVWSSPEQFKYPVMISAGAVAMAAACFAAYVRKERGHLLHRSRCLGGDKPHAVGYARIESVA
ncbi:hypothetical protein N7493_007794 [Penicillium malachiteum]|uniref:Solute carrier family 40 member n=1 Tax=Penicillium malachiteum TaxID=1324776 RepID=A0AAD6HIC6_9EURO|nr:hypothetical protein N7493_007794 [Penicillium malachiteum]